MYASHKRRKQRELISIGIILFMLAAIISFLLSFCMEPLTKGEITLYSNETEAFREMSFSSEWLREWIAFSRKRDEDKFQVLTILMALSGFDLKNTEKKKIFSAYEDARTYYIERKAEEFEVLLSAYEAIWKDVRYFPIPASILPDAPGVSYENSWGSERSYRNTGHLHEGTDIMAGNNLRGYFPVLSMTDGVVERIGWLEKGGYRIGIRSPSGGYFYYAHLYSYAEDFKEGDTVIAGQMLGLMGDTGYSKVEGTVGNFDVHLHLGIYIKTAHFSELAVNPYWILKYIEAERLQYSY